MKNAAILSFIFLTLNSVNCYVEPVVIVHGGADTIPEHRIQARLDGVKSAANTGYRILKKGGSVVDAVEAAVRAMESDSHFNAGLGSALNADGEVEMDASIMVGGNLSSGSVAIVKHVEHPISLARLVMERTNHFGLAGEGAGRFAREHGMPYVRYPVDPQAKKDLDEILKTKDYTLSEKKGSGGVGAIAIDSKGRMAVAASAGGSFAKIPGRISSSSIIGAGIYVDDEIGAACATGYGEGIARYNFAHEIINNMKKGFDPGMATRNAVKGLAERFHKASGAITLSKNGQIGISFSCPKMAWAYQIRDDLHYGIDDYDDFREKIIL